MCAGTRRVSVSALGAEGDDYSDFGTLTEEGSVAVFQSQAENLSPDFDTGTFPTIYAATDTPLAVRWPRDDRP